jgi:hypothetical protein
LQPEHGLYHPLAVQAIAEPSEPSKFRFGDTIAAARKSRLPASF